LASCVSAESSPGSKDCPPAQRCRTCLWRGRSALRSGSLRQPAGRADTTSSPSLMNEPWRGNATGSIGITHG
jgi:hypothetical protein